MDTTYVDKITGRVKGKFTKIPNFVISKKLLSDGSFRTYATLKSYKIGNNKVFPSVLTLADSRGRSRKSISNHLNQLKHNGLISTQRRGFSKSNSYTFTDEDYPIKKESISEKNYTSLRKETTQLIRKELLPNNIKIKNTEFNKSDKSSNKGIEQCRETLRGLGLKR